MNIFSNLRILAVAAALGATCWSPTAWAGAPHFVVDIDNVLLDWAGADRPAKKLVRSTVDGTDRIVADGAGEFLASLRAIPGAKVSFYSTKPMEIIERSLDAIHLPDGQSARNIAFSVHSAMVNGPDGYEALRHKDLRVVVGDGALADVVLIDDTKRNAAPGQEKNLLWARRVSPSAPLERYNHKVLASSLRDQVGTPMTTAQAFVADRNSLVRVRGLIEAAQQMSHERGTSLTDALATLQWLPGGFEPRDNLMTNLDYYRRGISLLKQQRQSLRFVSLVGSSSRTRAVKTTGTKRVGNALYGQQARRAR